jgi:hypothetical protein
MSCLFEHLPLKLEPLHNELFVCRFVVAHVATWYLIEYKYNIKQSPFLLSFVGCRRRLLHLWHTSDRASSSVYYKCGGMVHLMMQPCTYTL